MTLVEILAVVVLLGLVAGVLAVGFSGSFGKAKHELAKTGIAQVVQKLELYRIEKNEWPSLELGLRALSVGHSAPTDPHFLEPDQLLDPWDRPYVYITPGPELRPYEVLSYGRDGIQGGAGEDADVSSADLREGTG
jgi:general secretion pathway protein G